MARQLPARPGHPLCPRSFMTQLPTYDDIVAAAGRIDGHAHTTPVLTSSTLDEALGAKVFFKCENFQRVGAFKFRGAFNALSKFTPAQRRAGVVAFSSGNHAQAVALSARLLGMPATIVMPHDAPAAKVAATRGYGATVVVYDRYREDRERIGRDLATRHGLTLVPPYDHADVVAGQGTAAKELFDEVGALDALFVPLGGGGLLAGCALSARALAPNCKLFGVEPEAGNDGQRSLRSGSIVHIAPPRDHRRRRADAASGRDHVCHHPARRRRRRHRDRRRTGRCDGLSRRPHEDLRRTNGLPGPGRCASPCRRLPGPAHRRAAQRRQRRSRAIRRARRRAMNSATRMALDVRHYGAAPGSHQHAHAQVLWSLRGALELEVDRRGMLLGAGQAVLLPPGQRHDFHAEASHHLAAFGAHALTRPDPPAAALLAMPPAPRAGARLKRRGADRRPATTHQRLRRRDRATLPR
jgi:threonine dehydratase